MNLNLKLDDMDIMAHSDVLSNLLGTYLGNYMGDQFDCGAYYLSIINNTLVIQPRSRHKTPDYKESDSVPRIWNYYKAITDPAPGGDDSTYHYQLLRYNIGPLSCVVQVPVNGTFHRLPDDKAPSRQMKARNLHGIDVTTAGKGVLPHLTFQVAEHQPKQDLRLEDLESRRISRWLPRVALSFQTSLGIVNAGPHDQGAKVVAVGAAVRQFQSEYQYGLRRFARLLETLRDTIREHGGPCVAVYNRRRRDVSGVASIDIHIAGLEEVPVLLDWQKEHFWSNKGGSDEQHSRPQKDAADEHAQPQSGVMGRLARWFGIESEQLGRRGSSALIRSFLLRPGEDSVVYHPYDG